MRVLAVTPAYPRFPGDYHGGFIRDLCVELHRQGVDIRVLAPRSRTMKPTPTPFPVERFPYLPSRDWETIAEETMKGAPLKTLIRLPAYLASGAYRMEGSEAEVIHSHIAIPLGWAASYTRKGVPKVVTCHGSDVSLPLEKPVYRPFTARALKTADRVVAVSDHVRAMAEQLGARGALTIYNGIDTERFKPDPGREPNGSGITLGTLGRLVPEKNIEQIIEAAKIIQSSAPVSLLIAGGGPHRAALERHCHRAGVDAVFTGPTDTPECFYPRLDVFALASTHEGLSTSLREAMASGCACVAVLGGGSEEAIADGVDGRLCEPGDPSALAEAILSAAGNPALGREARRTVERRFSLRRSAEEYIRLYRELAE